MGGGLAAEGAGGHAAILRSPHAHAEIAAIDASAARANVVSGRGFRHGDPEAAFARAARDFAAKGLGELGDCALTEAAIEAARAEASTGEMMGVLKEALGWQPPHEY